MRSGCIISEWWVEQYAEDIHNYLRTKEKRCMRYKMQSPQLSHRQYFVDYISSICEEMHFCVQVKHLAVYILDLFMDNYVILLEHFHLVALGCLIVAVKVDEEDALIPRMSDLNALLGNTYELRDFVSIEVCIMKFLKWDLLMPTVATFVEYYKLFAISTSDYHANMPLKDIAEAKQYISRYIDDFLEMSLQEVIFRQFSPSCVAASCIAASRIYLLLVPTWPQHLRDITHRELTELSCCLEIMINVLDVEETVSRKKVQVVPNDSNSCSSHDCSEDGGGSSSSSSGSASSTPRIDSDLVPR